jgi:hypothetical protein
MTSHEEIVDNGQIYLSHLVQELGNSYDFLYNKGVDLTSLATAIDALSAAKESLETHKSLYKEYIQKIRGTSNG